MNRSKRILSSLGLVKSLYSTRFSTATAVNNQVTRFSIIQSSSCVNSFQKRFLSSKPEPFVELVLSSDWCKQFEYEITVLDPKLNYETVICILRRLDKDPIKAWNFFNWVIERPGFSSSSTLYSLLLRILANKDSMKQFWLTLPKMKELGFYLDDETYQTILGVFKYSGMASDSAALKHFYNRMIKSNAMDDVVKDIATDVTLSDWGCEFEKKLDEMNIMFSDNFVVRLLKELRQCPQKALQVFRWIGKSSSYQHNAVTYNALVQVLGQFDSIVEFWEMVGEMKSKGHEMDLDTYVKISRRFQRCKRLNDAVALYKHMMNSPYKPSVEDCGVLLRSIAANPDPNMDLVFKVVRIFESEGNVLSKYIYDAIHRSLASVGRFDEAERMMKAMRKAGYKPDNITYSQLIFGLCKAGKLEEASKTIDVMEENGCVADIKTWTILIQGYCRANQVQNAIVCFAKMIEKDCQADADLLDVLINGFYSQKKVIGAYKLLIEMVKETRLRPWQATYKTMIMKLLGERKLEEALEILVLMKKHNYPVFAEPFDKFISKHGTVEDALEFLKVLSNKEYPSIGAYQNVFKSFLVEGRHSEAKDLLFKCPHHVRNHQAICAIFGVSGKTDIDESAVA